MYSNLSEATSLCPGASIMLLSTVRLIDGYSNEFDKQYVHEYTCIFLPLNLF